MKFDEVINIVGLERIRQDLKWGKDNVQSLPGYIMILERLLNEVKDGWNADLPGNKAPLNLIVELAAVSVACLQQYGVTGNTVSTSDIPAPQV